MRQLSLLFLSSLFLFSSGKASKSSGGNESHLSLQLMDAQSETRFDSLPTEGEVDIKDKFWSGDHWPMNKGSINQRWVSGEAGFDLISPNKDEVSTMGIEALSRLSPAEKYDLLMGRYDYPLKAEVLGRSNRTALDWEGLGNGWALASMGHIEPKDVTLTNPDGVAIPFGSADVKALLTYYYALIYNAPSQQLGFRCFERMGWNDDKPECKDDMDAGSFHVVLANRIGFDKQTVFADLERYEEVWNHPIVGFKSDIEEAKPDENTPAGISRVLAVRTSIKYINKYSAHTWGRNGVRDTASRVYSYLLYINNDGSVGGGKWKSSDRPDFLWFMEATTSFSGQLEGLNQLLQ